MCGNQQLESLKFENGELSLLNVASIERWPEIGKQEIEALRNQHFPELKLIEKDFAQILKLSGGHPRLLHQCLSIRQKSKNPSDEQYNELLTTNEHIWQLFTPYCKDTRKEQLLKWLERDCLAHKEPFIINNLLRELYWKNLLVNRHDHLCWRCTAIRIIGKKVLTG